MVFEFNELLFFIHILLVMGFVLGALKLGAQALTALVALQAVLANLFVVKQMSLFGFSVTCSDVFAVGTILGLNLLQEHFGKEAAQRAVKISFWSLGFFFVMSQVHLWYQPIAADRMHGAFEAILSSSPRILAASIGAYWIVQKVDLALFGSLKRAFEGKQLLLRLGISLCASQLLDTVLFSFFGLYGLVESLFDVIVVSYAVKCSIIALGSPMAALSKRWVKDVAEV